MEEEKGISSEDSVRHGCPAPSLSVWKEHMRWYANSGKGCGLNTTSWVHVAVLAFGGIFVIN
jgi:hypothetical protein